MWLSAAPDVEALMVVLLFGYLGQRNPTGWLHTIQLGELNFMVEPYVLLCHALLLVLHKDKRNMEHHDVAGANGKRYWGMWLCLGCLAHLIIDRSSKQMGTTCRPHTVAAWSMEFAAG
jgi:hypothetical protein